MRAPCLHGRRDGIPLEIRIRLKGYGSDTREQDTEQDHRSNILCTPDSLLASTASNSTAGANVEKNQEETGWFGSQRV